MILLADIRKYRKIKAKWPRALLSAIRTLPLHYVRNASPESHVFVLGTPRSGTSLAFNIIKSHPDICGLDNETFFFCKRRFDNLHFENINDDALKTLREQSSNKVHFFDKIADYYKKTFDANYFAEKTPEHALFIDNLLNWFPYSKFIFVMRDGRDCFASAKRNPVVWANHGRMYPYVWRDTARAFLRVATHHQVMQLRYEALVKAPYETIRRVMRFLELELTDNQLDPNFYGATVFSSQTGQERLRTAISDATVGEWKANLSKSELDLFGKICGAPMRQLGY